MKSTVTLNRFEDAPALWIVRDHARFVGDLPDSNLALVEFEVPPGSGTPPHTHASPEIFRILSGEITFGAFDGEPTFLTAGPGSVVSVPSMAAHNYENRSGAPARMLVVLDQSMVTFFKELGKTEQPPAGPPSDEEISEVMAACARHGIHILGGPG
ncbi:MAG TPA: cupin domain-containing protein [Fimbriimonadaceae bacterium]|nr:cupin domain-containing protein [Fimbriimonadaceae bacterium]